MQLSGDKFYSVTPDGVALAVRVTPRGGADAVDGLVRMADGRTALKVRVRAPANEGEANAAVMRFLAGALGVAPRNVSLQAGATARLKRLKIVGDAASLTDALERMSGAKQ